MLVDESFYSFLLSFFVLFNLVSAAQIFNQQSCGCWIVHNIRVKDIDGTLFNQILLTPILCCEMSYFILNF
ncbi:hypothetical protein GW17_00012647 [Ensete ventricosum]|nr:hypothetical protein GW17_00012647 [Ensete ventricosum]RZS23845.1 hypothetical protein BHM03_00056847 [Ensete ventricosum]